MNPWLSRCIPERMHCAVVTIFSSNGTKMVPFDPFWFLSLWIRQNRPRQSHFLLHTYGITFSPTWHHTKIWHDELKILHFDSSVHNVFFQSVFQLWTCLPKSAALSVFPSQLKLSFAYIGQLLSCEPHIKQAVYSQNLVIWTHLWLWVSQIASRQSLPRFLRASWWWSWLTLWLSL